MIPLLRFTSLLRRAWCPRAAYLAAATAAALALASACAPAVATVRTTCADADGRLARIWAPLADALTNPDSCRPASATASLDPCAQAHRDLERLALACPNHRPTMMASAVLAYEEGRPGAAQQHLDNLFDGMPRHPDAAMLRARIALDEGNAPFARRLLSEQIALSPGHAGLREVYASVLYVSRDFAGASAALQRAAQLGAPGWRVAYHLGLIAEAQNDPESARRHYDEALAARPGWELAEQRRRALPGSR